MEKEKYYTPTIEEFHIGFEYELLGNSGNWYKNNFGDANGEYLNELSKCYWDVTHNKLRVKYLDQSDIESFGFKLSEKENRLYYEYVLGHDSLFIDKNNTINIFIENSNSDTIFDGKIKNKSEFSRLLKQLSII